MNKKVILAAVIGNILEFYDFILFGFLAPTLASLFFPTTSKIASLLSILAIFAVGFFIRPLGGVIFGHIGDKYGRKQALSLSIFLMSIPTFSIGLIPSYSQIGLLAPLILVLCRLLQGLCAGGEYNGSAIFTLEHSDERKHGLMGGLIIMGCVFGAFLGSLASYIVQLDFMPNYAWRFSFFVGVIIGFLGYWIRTKLMETPIFENAVTNKQIKKIPILSVIKEKRKSMMVVMGIGGFCGCIHYCQVVFLNTYLSEFVGYDANLVRMLVPLIIFSLLTALPIAGYLSDKLGIYKVATISAISSIVLAYPIFIMLNTGSFVNLVIVSIILSCLNSSFVAPSHAIMLKAFTPNQRYSGISFGFGLGMSYLGGTTPFIATYLIKVTDSLLSPASYLIFCAIIGLMSVIWSKKIALETESKLQNNIISILKSKKQIMKNKKLVNF